MPETQASASRPGETILDRIVAAKAEELAGLRAQRRELEGRADRSGPPRGFARALRSAEGVAVIAEIKRRSPGSGEIRPGLDPAELARSYERGGATALSVLTDGPFFGGSLDDLREARDAAPMPVLRKDFVVDELQVLEARAAGADAVLLIVRILDRPRLERLLERAERWGMDALVEVHDGWELERARAAGATLIGINNRDLSTFETRLEVTLELAERVGEGITLVSESGIRSRGDVELVGRAGVHAVLVGESLLRLDDPGAGVSRLRGQRDE